MLAKRLYASAILPSFVFLFAGSARADIAPSPPGPPTPPPRVDPLPPTTPGEANAAVDFWPYAIVGLIALALVVGILLARKRRG